MKSVFANLLVRYGAMRNSPKTVVSDTSGILTVSGEVRTDSDIDALKRVVNEAQPPRRPMVNVRVSSDPQ